MLPERQDRGLAISLLVRGTGKKGKGLIYICIWIVMDQCFMNLMKGCQACNVCSVDVGLITPNSPPSRSTRFEIGGIADHIPLIKVMT